MAEARVRVKGRRGESGGEAGTGGGGGAVSGTAEGAVRVELALG
jgi:hypothetical protein